LSKFVDSSLESNHLFEALIGSIYIDSNFENVYKITQEKFLPHLIEVMKTMEDIDYVVELEKYLKPFRTYAEFKFVERNMFYKNIPK
jgi:dsRNA-specific ribonuclease